MKTTPKLREWDSAEHIKTKEDAALYLKACLEEAGDDAGFVAKVVGKVESLLDKVAIRKLKMAYYQKKYREANKEKVRAREKACREANKEKVRARKKACREANKEKNSAYYKAYYEANKEKLKAMQRAYYEVNKEKLYARAKDWRKANKEKVRAREKAYREANKEKAVFRSKAYREANPNMDKEWVKKLSPGYVSKLLQMKVSEAPPELLELKREQLLIIRLNRELKKEMKNV